ncbi:D-serine deaminase, pyridoxal phosphate-dependent [Chitinophaga ginsengisegetis]|uniref:D-serine deaminase, pyridoxal phosphate-dependent n=1 Tax=Chitinophaga ginsengisegetis TaxID=393003 RepID=A0A1T5PCA7_9BACT|nr:D-TA family PLP-dependent enzyme [Chitinophaga ginsengisegetis]SKD10018.1 D-serine deaminase, pyridoxal phosphate-dependent [Chitinophaga ginsengisegetis]
MTDQQEWFVVENESKIDSPALLVFPEYISRNISAIIELTGDLSTLRPHVKTDKTPEIIQLMRDAGINKYKCATIAEAEMLAMMGVKDVLLAYQPTIVKAQRLFALMRAYPGTRFSCLVDNLRSAEMLSFLVGEKKLTVYIDLNVGMNRTGIPVGGAFMLYMKISKLQNIEIAGLHAYDGHVDDADPITRTERAKAIFAAVMALKGDIEWKEKETLELVIGGSPTFAVYSEMAGKKDDKSIQVSPGTFTLWDAGYHKLLPDLPFKVAAVLLCRVVSIINNNLLCIDLGYKSVSAENPLDKRVVFPWAPEVVPVSQSEEHMVISVPDTKKFNVGDTLYGVPWHICPTLALYERVHVVKKKRMATTWKVVARDRMINY